MSQEPNSGGAAEPAPAPAPEPAPYNINVPPPFWDEKELARLGVTAYAKVPPSDLTGVPHPIFARERWRLADESRFDAMQQSILLASYLLETGLPYLASFLPKPTYGKDSQGNKFVHIKDDVSPEEIQVVRDELKEIMKGLQWAEDGSMLKKRGWFGSTSQEFPRPEKSENYADGLRYWDRKCREAGHDRRQSTIFIAKEYIDVLLKRKRETQEHITTAFHLALSLVHEIGHLVYWQDFDNKVELGQGFVEPWVARQSRMGLGLAFTAWIFGGWSPYPIYFPNRVRRSFISGMSWSKQLASEDDSEFDLLDRPTWGIQYSMPFKHLQRIMKQKTWDDIRLEVDKLHATRSFLPPDIPFRNGRDTRVTICKMKRVKGKWVWKRGPYSACRFNPPPEENGTEDNAPFEFYDPYWDDEPLSPVPMSVLDESEVDSDEASEYQSEHESDDEFTDEYDDETEDERQPDDDGFVSGAPLKKMNIRVTWSGMYDPNTKTVEPFNQRKRPADESNQEGPRKILKLAQLMEYSEDSLRKYCSAQHVPPDGTKEELAQRLVDHGQAIEPSPKSEPTPPAVFVTNVLVSRTSTGSLLYQHIAKTFKFRLEMLHLMLEDADGKRVVLKPDDVLVSLDPKALSNLLMFRTRSVVKVPPSGPRIPPFADEKNA